VSLLDRRKYRNDLSAVDERVVGGVMAWVDNQNRRTLQSDISSRLSDKVSAHATSWPGGFRTHRADECLRRYQAAIAISKSMNNRPD
jgi:hypothetical protein